MGSPRKSRASAQKSVAIIGGGRVGSALASLLSRLGQETTLWSRRPLELAGVRCYHGEPAPAELRDAGVIVIAVRDEAITPVAQTLRALLASGARRPEAIVHVSGAHPAAEVLAPLVDLVPVGTMHPLIAVRSAEQGMAMMPRAFWALEGSDIAVAICADMIEAFLAKGGPRPLRLKSEDLALYHACAVIASNHAVALWATARDTLRRLGRVDPKTATAMLVPLLESTLANVETHGLPEALTGPIRRGDLATLRRHLAALRARAPSLVASYRADAELAHIALGRGSDDGSNLAMMLESEEE
ncbi:MAG: hypothetical protein CSA65_00805 [Proteobacteria bacterium]|nr:MAG: hypothetical protein CSB49_07905 [Pseudomonadota bacterium]PIE19833.1 MAG: hypothetical protein CSA65_00805 [Pseudomonadota bacterium]